MAAANRTPLSAASATTPVPIAVYFFVTADPATCQPGMRQCCLILRLRSEDNDFYNELSPLRFAFGQPVAWLSRYARGRLRAGKLLPPSVEWNIGVITDDETALTFLSKNTPLWPVIEEH